MANGTVNVPSGTVAEVKSFHCEVSESPSGARGSRTLIRIRLHQDRTYEMWFPEEMIPGAALRQGGTFRLETHNVDFASLGLPPPHWD